MTSTRTSMLLVTATAVAALAACGHSSPGPDTSVRTGSLAVRDGQVVIAASNGAEARISPEGRLTIAGEDVAVTEGQRAQLVSYYNAASGVYRHAAATGAAGAAVGVAAATSVVAGLAKGDLSEVGAKVEAKAGDVRRAALKICDSLAEVRAAQDALSARLPAFKPYAVVSEHETSDCARGLRNAPGG